MQYVALSSLCESRQANSFIILKHAFVAARWKKSTGSDMIQTRVHENDINSDDENRISVDTDSSEGLTSR